MLKSVARLTFLAAALVFASSAVFGQTARPKARQQFDSLASASRAQRVEMAACVVGDNATIDSLTPARYTDADSVTVYTDGALYCPRGVASIHTHLHTAQPSPLDRHTMLRSGAGVAYLLAVRPDGTYVLVRY